MKRNEKILLLVSILVSIGLLELGLRLLTPFPIHDPASNLVPHEALGYVLAPDYLEADGRGFRNDPGLAAADSVDIVAIGDSHTYGFNVSGQESWPAALAESTGKTVYNYGMGGYGILQYKYLFEEALKKHPESIIVGFFLMNDLANYCQFASNPYWHAELAAAGLNYEICGSSRQGDEVRFEEATQSIITSTAIGSMLDTVRSRYFYSLGHDGVTVSVGPQRTWTHLDRLVAIEWQTNTEVRRIAEGRQAAFYVFSELARLAAEADVNFGVLIIPSRERVLFPYLESGKIVSEEWQQAVQNEETLVEQFGNFFAAANIEFVDSLPLVRDALERGIRDGIPIYPAADGHPLPAGYRAYAEAARVLLDRL